MAQGIVAFQQRLYDKEKAEEVVNLHQVIYIIGAVCQKTEFPYSKGLIVSPVLDTFRNVS